MTAAPRDDRPLHIVQIAPDIAPGSGVAGVAAALEKEFIAVGATVERFTRAEAGGRPPKPGSRLSHVRDVVWFSTVGTRRARAFLAARPDAVSICHNDAMVGDVYVNHGLLEPAMRARGRFWWRMIRNPLHLFTAGRDRVRYRGSTHRRLVALTELESELMLETYRRVGAPITVIPNGVDIERFRPPSAEERASARSALGLGDAFTGIFIGHEFDRKGLTVAIDALARVDGVNLIVVGGDRRMISAARSHASAVGATGRVTFAGILEDPLPALWAADALVLPSAYESSGLVFFEALACGVPLIATTVGAAPELVAEGGGVLAERTPESVASALTAQSHADRAEVSTVARRIAEHHAWPRVAQRYLDLLRSVRDDKDPAT